MTAINAGLRYGGDENALKLDSGDGCTTLNILKTTELYILKRVNLMVYELYLNLKQ